MARRARTGAGTGARTGTGTGARTGTRTRARTGTRGTGRAGVQGLRTGQARRRHHSVLLPRPALAGREWLEPERTEPDELRVRNSPVPRRDVGQYWHREDL